MRTTRQFSITLPLDMAAAVERKVKSGVYASVSEVVRDGVRALLERDAAVERWLRDEVAPGHREYLAGPTKACRRTRCSRASSPAAGRASRTDVLWRSSSHRLLNATSSEPHGGC
jgi:antitoxin ParD1/3/4